MPRRHDVWTQPLSVADGARGRAAQVASDATKVVVVGAAGRTGSLVLGKLLARPEEFVAKGVVRPPPARPSCPGLGLAAGPSHMQADSLLLAPLCR